MAPSPTFQRSFALVSLLGLCALASQGGDDVYGEDQVAVVLPVTLLEAEPLEPFGASPDGGVRVSATQGGDVLEVLGADGGWSALAGPSEVLAGPCLAESKDAARRLIVWDEFAGDPESGGSFDVLGALSDGAGGFGAPFVIAEGPRFQARPSAAATRDGHFYVAWEEGADAWGAEYRSVDKGWNNAADARGPLHSWRAVRLARIDLEGRMEEIDVPMPSFGVQARNPKRRPGAARLGVFYERPSVFVDDADDVWLAYRHIHQREAGCVVPKITTHVERGFWIDVRRFREDAFGPVLRLAERQRDGEQRLAWVSPTDAEIEAGAAAALQYETGRRDRRKDPQPAGVCRALLPAVTPPDAGSSVRPGITGARIPRAAAGRQGRGSARPPRTTFEAAGGQRYTLAFGDLHRHTDLSLCFPFFDGSIDDAYRYARGPGALDFLGLTDHARDLDRGRPGSRPWKLTVAAADRHHQPGRFVAFRSYERSQGNTDHNVLSLVEDADFLRPHTPPLTEFWSEFPGDALLTIPHATSWRPGARFCGDVWQKRDDVRRPIAEIYQGGRDVSSMMELQREALLAGQKLGFIASSDHMSTSGSYACVWAQGAPDVALNRAPIYRALKERRCYGATARLELKVMCGERWMGEDLPGGAVHPIDVSVRGTGPLERIEFWSDGARVHCVEPPSKDGVTASAMELQWAWSAPSTRSYVFVRIVQADGNEAWSSPFFANWPEVTGD